MEMDRNLKILANFWRFSVLCIVEESLKTDYSLLFPGEILYIFFPVLEQQFHFRKTVLCKNIEQFWPLKIQQNRRDSAPLREVSNYGRLKS